MKRLFEQESEGSSQDTVCLTGWELPGSLAGEMPPTATAGIWLELPSDMAKMGQERKDALYPYEDRPEVILSDGGENLQLTFQLTDYAMKPEDTFHAADQASQQARQEHPENHQSPVYLYGAGSIPVGWFLTEMAERQWEHMKAVFSVNRKMALMTLTYHQGEKAKWRPLLKHIFGSMQELR